MATLTELIICNMALVKIGSAKISALADKADVNLSELYAQVRDRLLTRYQWPFAKKREQLEHNPDDDTPPFEYGYTFDLPLDYLGNAESYNSNADFVIEGNTILTNDDVVYLRYTAKITNASLFPSLFVECLVLELASELAIPIANDTTLQTKLLLELKDKLRDNGVISAYEDNITEEIEDTSWQSEGR